MRRLRPEDAQWEVDRPEGWQPSIRATDPFEEITGIPPFWLEQLINKGKRAGNAAIDMFGTDFDVSDMINPMGMPSAALGMMSEFSPLRNPVYRKKMLEEFRRALLMLGPDGQQYKPALNQLIKTHPRTVAAFQHAGGQISPHTVGGRMPEGAAGAYWSEDAFTPVRDEFITNWGHRNPGGLQFSPPAPMEGFTSLKGLPNIQLRVDDLGGGLHPNVPPFHEFTHFAQDLGGSGPRMPSPLHGSAETISELGAERGAIKQHERLMRRQHGDIDWNKYKGIGHEDPARYIPDTQLMPGYHTKRPDVSMRWLLEHDRMIRGRRDPRLR